MCSGHHATVDHQCRTSGITAHAGSEIQNRLCHLFRIYMPMQRYNSVEKLGGVLADDLRQAILHRRAYVADRTSPPSPSAAASTSTSITLPPSARNSCAVASPTLPAPPVMMQTLPASIGPTTRRRLAQGDVQIDIAVVQFRLHPAQLWVGLTGMASRFEIELESMPWAHNVAVLHERQSTAGLLRRQCFGHAVEYAALAHRAAKMGTDIVIRDNLLAQTKHPHFASAHAPAYWNCVGRLNHIARSSRIALAAYIRTLPP